MIPDRYSRHFARLGKPEIRPVGIGIWLGGGQVASGGVTPSTVNYSYAQAGPSLTGTLDPTSLAGKIRLYCNQVGQNYGLWTGLITGTEALITLFNTVSSTPAGMVEVSINGGAFAAAAVSGGRYVLFTGQPQATYLVVARIISGYGRDGNMPTSGTVLTVTGAPPDITVFNNWVQPTDGNANTVGANTPVVNPAPGAPNFLPLNVISIDADTNQNIPTMAVRGDPTSLAIFNRGRYVYVSIDGAAPTEYDRGATGDFTTVITGLSGTHTYYIWGSTNNNNQRQMCVGGIYATGISNIAQKGRLDQYGDSITAGLVPIVTNAGVVDCFRVAVALGRVGGNYGIPSDTIALCLARMPDRLANKVVTSDDVAVVALGRNNTGGTFDATELANYESILDLLLAAGYGRIICRGILPSSGSVWPLENASIQGIVAGRADPKIVFLDTSSWPISTTVSSPTVIRMPDGVHPDAQGYVTLTDYCIPAYAALI